MLNDVYKVDKINLHYSKHPIWLLLSAAPMCSGKMLGQAALNNSKVSTISAQLQTSPKVCEYLMLSEATLPLFFSPGSTLLVQILRDTQIYFNKFIRVSE